MDNTIKTVKIHAYSEDPKSHAPQSNLTEEQAKALELVNKNLQLEEEKKKSFEYKKTIEQLNGSLIQEQARTAEMAKKTLELEAKFKELAALEAGEFVKHNALLEEERKKSLDHLQTIEQLRGSLKQEQEKSAEMVNKMAGIEAKLEAKSKELSVLEDKVKGLAELEAKVKELAALENKAKEASNLEAKVNELTGALVKIAAIAATVNAG